MHAEQAWGSKCGSQHPHLNRRHSMCPWPSAVGEAKADTWWSQACWLSGQWETLSQINNADHDRERHMIYSSDIHTSMHVHRHMHTHADAHIVCAHAAYVLGRQRRSEGWSFCVNFHTATSSGSFRHLMHQFIAPARTGQHSRPKPQEQWVHFLVTAFQVVLTLVENG